jgi:hypothetical protein
MRDRKLSDQTLPRKGSRNPSFTFEAIVLPCHTKVKKMHTYLFSKHFISVAGTPFGQNLVIPVRFPKGRMARNRSIAATEKILSSRTVWR